MSSANNFINWCVNNGKRHVVARDLARRERRERLATASKPRGRGKFRVNDKRKYYREEYLKSDHWKDLKARKLEQSPQCEQCGSVFLLDVHHMRYRNLYDVELTDLKTLCRKCHKALHRWIDERRQAKRKKPWIRILVAYRYLTAEQKTVIREKFKMEALSDDDFKHRVLHHKGIMSVVKDMLGVNIIERRRKVYFRMLARERR